MLRGVVLVALVSLREEVLPAEGLSAMLARKRQEVDEVASRRRALLSNLEKSGIALSGCGSAGHGGISLSSGKRLDEWCRLGLMWSRVKMC